MREKAPKKTQFSLNVGPELLRRYGRIARKNDSTLTFVIRHVLKTYLPEVERRGLFNLLEVK